MRALEGGEKKAKWSGDRKRVSTICEEPKLTIDFWGSRGWVDSLTKKGAWKERLGSAEKGKKRWRGVLLD